MMTPIGQEETLRAFCRLSAEEQEEIICFIDTLPLFEEIEIQGVKYILVHAGLPDFIDIPPEYYAEYDLLFGPHDYFSNHYSDGTKIIVGHLPTRFIDGAIPDEIYHINDTIAIDCGCGFRGRLVVLCLHTGEELYF